MGFNMRFALMICSVAVLIFSTGFSFAQESYDCTSCHKDIRHGQQNNTFCINCHTNYDLAEENHVDENISQIIPFVHRAFDWEGDNLAEQDFPEDESCPACHVSIHDMTSARVAPELFRKCEDCHISGGAGPVPRKSGWDLRNDIDSFIPKVYAHYTGAKTMDVKNQAGTSNGSSISSCFDYNIYTGDGTCHGIGELQYDGEYFAHSNDTEKAMISGLYLNPSDPYQYDLILDYMPDTSDCMFCHYQQNESVRSIWGGAVQPTSEVHINASNADCWECHTKDGSKPVSFHSSTMGDKENAFPWSLFTAGMIVVLLTAGTAYYFFIFRKE